MRKMNEKEHESITPKVLASSSPGLSFGNPGDHVSDGTGTLKGFGCGDSTRLGEPFQGCAKYRHSLSQGFKANPGLRLANTFGVRTLPETKSFARKQELGSLLHRLITQSKCKVYFGVIRG
jgi:hypothetical protein